MSRIIVLVIIIFSSVAYCGDGAGNGGDFIDGLKAAGLHDVIKKPNGYNEETVKKYQREFRDAAIWGLFLIDDLIREQKKFYDANGAPIVITTEDILEGLRILRKITEKPDKKSFRLNNELMLNNRYVVAINHSDNSIDFNPVRWNSIDELYQYRYRRQLQAMVATHEILSLLSKKIEYTGFYGVSSEIIKLDLNSLDSKDSDHCGRKFMKFITLTDYALTDFCISFL